MDRFIEWIHEVFAPKCEETLAGKQFATEVPSCDG